MIFDGKTNLAVDCLGWVDHGSLWTYNIVDKKEQRVPIAGASYAIVRKGENGLFRVVQQENAGATITIRHFQNPAAELARIRVESGVARFDGDDSLWGSVENVAIVGVTNGQRLIWINASARSVIDLDISWFNNDNYDVGYSGLIDCITLPGGTLVLVSAQRSSRLSIVDLQQNKEVESLKLVDRNGNPQLAMLDADELLTSDYDTMCRVNLNQRRVVASALLQQPVAGFMHEFIGDFDLHGNGTCAVARPFSEDVLLLNVKTLQVTKRVRVGGQPLRVSMVSDSDVITRDWKTGRLAIATFN